MIKIGLIDNVEPSSFSIDFKEIEDGSTSLRMADGTYMRDIIATKRTLNLEWSALAWNELSTILTALNEPFVDITYPDSISGTMETREFYVISRSTPVAFVKEEKDELGQVVNHYYWKNVSVRLEER